MWRPLASEEKWACPVAGCASKCKVRQMRLHLKGVHRWAGSTFSCQVEGCGWRCSKDMHCINNHYKSDHPMVSNVVYKLVPTSGADFDKEGQHYLSCFSDLPWHKQCIEKIRRKGERLKRMMSGFFLVRRWLRPRRWD